MCNLKLIVFVQVAKIFSFVQGIPLPLLTLDHRHLTSKSNDFHIQSSHVVIVDDMIFTSEQSRAGLDGAGYEWPDNTVPFSIDPTIGDDQRRNIEWSINQIEMHTCIKFRPTMPNDKYNILFVDKSETEVCQSWIGCLRKRDQEIQLSVTCANGTAAHEIIHALGFMHEQTRNDRDNYIRVNFNNIQKDMKPQFEKDYKTYPSTNYHGVPYNYDSIMHYGRKAFSANQRNTIDLRIPFSGNIRPLGNPRNLGQRTFLSEGDILMIRDKYNCN